jgi:two-component system KDP operon response regulator KdpE
MGVPSRLMQDEAVPASRRVRTGRLGTTLFCAEAGSMVSLRTASALEARGWAVSTVNDTDRARWLASVRTFHAIVIAGCSDNWLTTTLTAVRAATTSPILVLAGGGLRRHGVLVELGADMVAEPHPSDDWVFAAVAALARRSAATAPVLRYLECEGLTLDVLSRKIIIDGVEAELSPIEFGLLQVLMTHAQVALRHQAIIKDVWNWKYGDDRNALRIQVTRLRKKLNDTSDEPRFIRSLRSYGYSFIQPVSQLADDLSVVGAEPGKERIAGLASELRRLGRLLQTASNLQDAVEKLVRTVVEHDVCDAAAVLARDDSSRLRLMAQCGMPEAWVNAVRQGVPLDHAFISAETVLTAQTYHFVDITAAPHRYGSSARLLKAAHLPVMLSVPLANRSGIWGQLGYSATADHAFTPAHLMLLEGAGLILGALGDRSSALAATESRMKA